MIYNRYIPGSNGIYKREIIKDTHTTGAVSSPVTSFEKKTEPDSVAETNTTRAIFNPDLGDILLLCIAVLLIIDGDGEDSLLPIIAAAILFLR